MLLRKRLDRAAAWYLVRDGGGDGPSGLVDSSRRMARQRGAEPIGVRLGLRVAYVGGRGGLRGQDEAVWIGYRGNNHAERR